MTRFDYLLQKLYHDKSNDFSSRCHDEAVNQLSDLFWWTTRNIKQTVIDYFSSNLPGEFSLVPLQISRTNQLGNANNAICLNTFLNTIKHMGNFEANYKLVQTIC